MPGSPDGRGLSQRSKQYDVEQRFGMLNYFAMGERLLGF
jgi:hypothetical protein